MKKTTFYSVPVLLFLFLITNIGCNRERMVVPFDFDVDEIFKPLSPNEDENLADTTFGPQKIAGTIMDYEIPTEYSDIFIFFNNLTLLDVKPQINQQLFEFIQDQLCEYGFNNDSVSLAPNEYQELMASGLNYSQAAAHILDVQRENFNSQLDSIHSYSSHFNIYFKIYPVFLTDEFVTYRLNSYSYTGGAHGITVSLLKSFDLNSGKELKLDDIVKQDRIQDIRYDVAAQMAYSYPIYENIKSVSQYLDSLNVWLDNFENDGNDDQITLQNYPLSDPALTSQGLVFIYQMYQLTPGSDGCPVVLIPYEDIKGFLKVNI